MRPLIADLYTQRLIIVIIDISYGFFFFFFSMPEVAMVKQTMRWR